MKRSHAIAGAVGLALSSFGFVYIFLGDGLLQGIDVPAGREHRAAVAIRDNVTSFQKWGTRLFTWRYLTRYYAAAWYFTQSKADNQKEAFLACLDSALEHYPTVDLFLLAHTNEYVSWAATLPESHRQRIRLVYNTGCHNLPQGQQWLELGAKVYVGHPGVSTSPVFYYYFLRRWVRGVPVRQAMEESNTLAWRKFRETEAATWGRVNAESVVRESWASCRGKDQLHIGDSGE